MDLYVSLHFYGKPNETFYKIYKILFYFFGVHSPNITSSIFPN